MGQLYIFAQLNSFCIHPSIYGLSVYGIVCVCVCVCVCVRLEETRCKSNLKDINMTAQELCSPLIENSRYESCTCRLQENGIYLFIAQMLYVKHMHVRLWRKLTTFFFSFVLWANGIRSLLSPSTKASFTKKCMMRPYGGYVFPPA
jgi:hypothetical protein